MFTLPVQFLRLFGYAKRQKSFSLPPLTITSSRPTGFAYCQFVSCALQISFSEKTPCLLVSLIFIPNPSYCPASVITEISKTRGISHAYYHTMSYSTQLQYFTYTITIINRIGLIFLYSYYFIFIALAHVEWPHTIYSLIFLHSQCKTFGSYLTIPQNINLYCDKMEYLKKVPT